MHVIREAGAVRRRVAVALFTCSVLLLSACQSGSQETPSAEQRAAGTGPSVNVSISPADGTSNARPDRGVVVRSAGGELGTVSVKAGGEQIAGDFNTARTEWRSKWTLAPSTAYTVTATAKPPDGKTVRANSNFTTLKPEQTISASVDWILEGNQGKTYGVGTPIILNFDRPVYNKKRVEKALEVKAEKPVEGAWRWIGRQQIVYRTKTYWPAHQKVRLIAHLSGVRAAKGVYGVKDLSRTFEIGAERITKIDLKKYKMTVRVDDRKVRTVPISAGNGTTLEYTTSSGVHLTMEKGNPVRMISPGREKGDPGYYDLLINYAVRISSSGEYLHQTAGENYCLGKRHCSHGCIRQPPKDAKWFYRTVQPGDVVDVTGSRRELDWNNGWSYWQLPFTTWKKGSALT